MTDRVSHTQCPFGCGSSDAYTENNEKGVGKCFSCGRSLRLNISNNPDIIEYKEFKYPSNDLEVDIYKLNWQLLKKYKIFYAPKLEVKNYVRHNQLVLPSFLDGKYLGCQLKSLNGWENIKYLTLANEPLIYYTKLKTEECETLVLTEDWLSAININYHMPSVECIALLNTRLTRRSVLYKFIRKLNPSKIIIWLDNDKPGQDGTDKVNKLFSNTHETKVINSKKEAKQCTQEEIIELI